MYRGRYIWLERKQLGLLASPDHADTPSPQRQGSGSFAYTGTLYFRSSTYATIFQVPGGTLTGARIWGDIVTDQLQITGSGALKMALNPNCDNPTGEGRSV